MSNWSTTSSESSRWAVSTSWSRLSTPVSSKATTTPGKEKKSTSAAFLFQENGAVCVASVVDGPLLPWTSCKRKTAMTVLNVTRKDAETGHTDGEHPVVKPAESGTEKRLGDPGPRRGSAADHA